MKIRIPYSAVYIAALLILPLASNATQSPPTPLWLDTGFTEQHLTPSFKRTQTQRRTLQLDENQLQARIKSATETQSLLLLEAPLPDGSNATIKLHPINTLSAELQQRYPNIRTWRISSSEPRILSGRAELTELGFRLMLRNTSGKQWLIEPSPLPTALTTQSRIPTSTTQSYYQSYEKRQSDQNTQTFSCGVQAGTETLNWQIDNRQSPLSQWQHNAENTQGNKLNRSGNKLLSYDLAISATGEYTQKFGGSTTAAYGAIVSTVNRINEIYEQELGITLKLVSGEETVFDNPATDPFDKNGLLSTAARNQEVLDILIGSNRYDIGHVLGAALSNNGVAYVSSLCNDGRKAQGITVSNAPLEDSFMVDYVAHEIGHQLGATHTFNSAENGCGGGGRIASTAFEPGSGSTIMSYAGLCSSHNLQQHVDPQFHSGSVDQIYKVLTGRGAACAQNIATTNNAPSVTAGNDHTIPARTPFILNGSASDSNGDTLLYSWDQLDIGDASAPDTDTANNPLIKSNPLSSSGMRYVPDIASLLDKSKSPIKGESLPRSRRQMNFRLSVRDGKGAIGSDDLKLSVYDTGQDFRVLSPTASLSAGSHEIRWQVAGTDQAPINCTAVDIAYTNNRGATFTDIKLKTPNDGDATVQLTQQAQHIRIKCSNNVFFALSSLTPHVAAYKNDTTQPEIAETDNTGTAAIASNATAESGDSGGGGTIPWYLLICGIFAALINIKGHRHKT